MTDRDRDTGIHFDSEPNTSRLLKPETRNFLTAYRSSDEFRLHSSNLSLTGDISRYSPMGQVQALWSRAFVERLFSLETTQDTERLLNPWTEWHKSYKKAWEGYYEPSYTNEEMSRRFDEYDQRAESIPIPDQILSYKGDLEHTNLRWLARFELFSLTQGVKDAVIILEGLPNAVPAKAAFTVQRITGQPYFPPGGLLEGVKPDIRREEIDGAAYFMMYPEEKDAMDLLAEDFASDADWQRWNLLATGMRVRNAQMGNSEAYDKSWGESGTVVGFDKEGAGELMVAQMGLKNVVIYVQEDGSGFLRYPLLRQLVLYDETAGLDNYTDLPFTRATTPITVVNFQDGSAEQTEVPNENVTGYVVDEVKKLLDKQKPEE